MISDEQCGMQVNLARAHGASEVHAALAELLMEELRKGAAVDGFARALLDEAFRASNAIHDEAMSNIWGWLELENVAS